MIWRTWLSRTNVRTQCPRFFSSSAVDKFLGQFINHEASGVPKGAGTDGKHGFDMGRMHALLDALGQPQTQLRVAHISGTKGKGSTAVMLSSIMKAANYKVGTYTSPHVVSLTERICIDGASIPEDELLSLAERYSAAITGVKERHDDLSHFEVLTGLALRHFADQKVDLAVIETGLGGARDATNVFTEEQLQVAIFTEVALEHSAALGGTLQSVAAAKAGIMRPGRPVVIASQTEDVALQVLHEAAFAQGCPRLHEQAELHHHNFSQVGGRLLESIGMYITNGEQEFEEEIHMRLVGRHQHRNAATAVTAALVLRQQGYEGVNIPAITSGLAKAQLPGRFQVARLMCSRPEEAPWLVLDGAHTAASATALAATLRDAFPSAPLALVVAMADDKDAHGIMTALQLARPEVVVFTTAPIAGSTSRCMGSGKLLAQWQLASMSKARGSVPQRSRELMSPSVANAVARAQQQMLTHGSLGVICVTGSLHAAAAAISAALVQPEL